MVLVFLLILSIVPIYFEHGCSSTLINHIIVDDVDVVKYTNVLPCSTISDHDAPYAILNVRKPRFEPRFKYIRDERSFDKSLFIEDVSSLPFSLVYTFTDPEDKLETLNTLLLECIERHAPLKTVKVTRPPAPWMNDETIRNLQADTHQLRYGAHKNNDDLLWDQFRQETNFKIQNTNGQEKVL